MSFSLLTIWRAARARAVPFAGESAGYLILLAAEELVTAPRQAGLQCLQLTTDGRVTVTGREPIDEARAESELRGALKKLLEAASSPGVALTRLAGRPASGSLRSFATELGKALIPMNRAAARRALERLYRETERADAGGRFSTISDATAVPTPLERQPDPELAAAGPPTLSSPTPGVVAFELPRQGTQRIAVPVRPATPPPPLPPREGEEVECLTSPETIVARRTLAARPPSQVDREDALKQEDPEETPRLGTLTASCDVIAPRDTLISELAEGEVTDGAPAVFEFEVPPLELDAGEWPVELADSGGAIPLEEERDALREPEIVLESPLSLSSLPLTVRDRTVHELPTLRPPETVPVSERPVESYPGMPGDRSDVRELLKGFQVGGVGDADLGAELRFLAGVDAASEPAPSVRRRQGR